MRYSRTKLVFGLFFIGGVAYAATPPLSQMTAAQKQQEQKYFTAHSFDFSSMFKAYHPGPYWILHHDQDFRLTNSQKTQETKLRDEMAMATIKDNRALKAAYHQYKIDGAQPHPSVSKINADISAVGRAQTRLAKEMVPFHLQSYNLLNTKQRGVYTSLAAETLQGKH